MSIQEILRTIASGFTQFSFFYVIDILLAAILIYKLIVLTKDTRVRPHHNQLAVEFRTCIGSSDYRGLVPTRT